VWPIVRLWEYLLFGDRFYLAPQSELANGRLANPRNLPLFSLVQRNQRKTGTIFEAKWINKGQKIGYRAVALVKDVLSSSSRCGALFNLFIAKRPTTDRINPNDRQKTADSVWCISGRCRVCVRELMRTADWSFRKRTKNENNSVS
jgi:hypothetical protein